MVDSPSDSLLFISNTVFLLTIRCFPECTVWKAKQPLHCTRNLEANPKRTSEFGSKKRSDKGLSQAVHHKSLASWLSSTTRLIVKPVKLPHERGFSLLWLLFPAFTSAHTFFDALLTFVSHTFLDFLQNCPDLDRSIVLE